MKKMWREGYRQGKKEENERNPDTKLMREVKGLFLSSTQFSKFHEFRRK